LSLQYYMDENVESAVTEALRKRGIDVLTAQEDDHRETADSIVFDRANTLGRVLVSEDSDMLREVTRRLRSGGSFVGVVFWHQQTLGLGTVVGDLELLSRGGTQADTQDQLIYLPL
jgi:hypothetical protein